MNASDEAAEWFVAQRTGELTAEEHERFMRWLGDSAANVREYLAVAELWGSLPATPGVTSVSAEDLIEALTGSATVTPLNSGPGISSPHRRAAQGRVPQKVLAAAACLLAIAGTAAWLSFDRYDAVEFITDRGEQRSLELPDGSLLQLNAVSHVVVTFDKAMRNIELRRGEALFQVAKDPGRPFEVVTPDARVRALGTKFNVYHRDAGTRVAVVEGKVQVLSLAAPVALGANESARVTSRGSTVSTGLAETRKVTAWTQRRLIFDEEPLGKVIAEFNLYNVKQLAVEADDELAQFRINGVFDADDPEALVAYLERVKGVGVEKNNSGIRLRRSTTH